MIHLDTNFLVVALDSSTAESARIRQLLQAGEKLQVSAVAWAEFLCGPLSARDLSIARAMFPEPEPIGPDDAALAAELFNAAGRRRNSLADCLIAACCIRCGAILATNNVEDFRRYADFGLRLVAP